MKVEFSKRYLYRAREEVALPVHVSWDTHVEWPEYGSQVLALRLTVFVVVIHFSIWWGTPGEET